MRIDPAKPPWRAALGAADAAGVSLIPLPSLEDAVRVAQVVEVLWGEGQLSSAMTRALQHAGTVLLGAEAAGTLVGFVLGFAGMDEGLHMHSHMLGVVPPWQSRGIGYALKLGQRAGCLDLGLEDVRWTYDPLVGRNARFNLVKLGVVATRILPGFYGDMDDAINRDDRSDRFEVRWSLRSERVDLAIRGEAAPPSPGPVLLDIAEGPDGPIPKETGLDPAPGAVVCIPADHHALRRRDPGLGRAWRDSSARAFGACFQAGLQATWITRDGRYTFEPAVQTAHDVMEPQG